MCNFFDLQTGAQLLEGDSLQYFGLTIPLNLAAATIAEVVLVGGAEYYRAKNESPLGTVSRQRGNREQGSSRNSYGYCMSRLMLALFSS